MSTAGRGFEKPLKLRALYSDTAGCQDLRLTGCTSESTILTCLGSTYNVLYSSYTEVFSSTSLLRKR